VDSPVLYFAFDLGAGEWKLAFSNTAVRKRE
jgi:hypothetical protein